MLTEERKAKVRALTDDDLEFEVNRGRASRFQNELFDFAKTELTRRKAAKREANETASLTTAKDGVKWTRWLVILTLLAIATTVALERCSSGN